MGRGGDLFLRQTHKDIRNGYILKEYHETYETAFAEYLGCTVWLNVWFQTPSRDELNPVQSSMQSLRFARNGSKVSEIGL